MRGLTNLAHVLVEVVDQQGRLVPDALSEVWFEVGGAGALAAVGDGNPHNADSFRLHRRHTWHGRVLAILRPAKRPGRLTLTARADGLRPASLTLQWPNPFESLDLPERVVPGIHPQRSQKT